MKYNRKKFNFHSRKARSVIKKEVLLDNYNGLIITNQKWDAEHVYPLSLAYHTGFKQMYKTKGKAFTEMQMSSFANNPINLIPTLQGTNRSRAAHTLWDWIPLNLAWIPERNRRVRLLADMYGLTLTRRMKWSMDWSDRKIEKYHNGLRMSKVRLWLVNNGFHKFLMPF